MSASRADYVCKLLQLGMNDAKRQVYELALKEARGRATALRECIGDIISPDSPMMSMRKWR
jgi:hypothetical protein